MLSKIGLAVPETQVERNDHIAAEIASMSASTTMPYWSMAILGVYLLLCSIPFFLISMGLGELLMSASLRMRKALLTANAALLIGLGLLLVVDTQRVADYLAAPADIVLVPFKWMV